MRLCGRTLEISTLKIVGARPRVCVICATPLAIHFFLQDHITGLSSFADVTVVTNLKNDTYTPALNLPVRIIQLEIFRKIRPWKDAWALLRLVELLRRERFDLVWAVAPKAGLLGMLAARVTGVKKRLFVFQGEVWASRNGIMRWFLKYMDRITSQCASHLLAVSHGERDFLVSENVATSRKLSVLGAGSIRGVDLDIYRPNEIGRAKIRAELGIDDFAAVAIYLGRVNVEKGILDLAIAFEDALKINSNLFLLVVGPDENNIAPVITKILALDTRRIKIIGFTDKAADYFAAADFLCLPSYREGFPISILEAAAVGIPTIGTRIYGITDAIVHEKTGLLVEPGNISQLTKAIIRFSEDEIFRKTLGAAARTWVAESFGHTMVIERYLNYFKRLILRNEKADTA